MSYLAESLPHQIQGNFTGIDSFLSGKGLHDHVPCRTGDDLAPPSIEKSHVADLGLDRRATDPGITLQKCRMGTNLSCRQCRTQETMVNKPNSIIIRFLLYIVNVISTPFSVKTAGSPLRAIFDDDILHGELDSPVF